MSGGVYVALFVLDRPRTLRVGRLGRFRFEAGRYAYVGSAQRNLDARLARHARRRKPLRWHVDYLARHARLEAAWTWPLPKSAECALAAAVGRCPGATPGPPRFGASDCVCPAHLVRLEGAADALRRLARRFGQPRPWTPKTVDRTPDRSYHSPTVF